MLDVLLVDDEPTVLSSVSDVLRADGHQVRQAADGGQALQVLGTHSFDLIICDMRLPQVDGLGIFKYVRQHAPNSDFVFITAFGAVSEAVAALKEGATDYLTKPFRLEELRARVMQIAKSREVRRELAWMRNTLAGKEAGTKLIGRSPALKRALERIDTFAHSDYPVLITGESGTGKELVARMLHENSSRAPRPMVTVNCAAFPETLIEAELFGYRRGAFTGAFQDREGRFRAAHRGTLFLDEVAEMPLAVQAKLLRVVQEGQFEPLGGNDSQKVDVRLLSATHRDLKDRVARGLFREDLYYRLKVLSIEVPPLRERLGDLPALINHFLRSMGRGFDKGLSAAALAALAAYDFPGNVRELEHAIQHASVLSRGGTIHVEHLPNDIAGVAASSPYSAHLQASAAPAGLQSLPSAMHAFEREYLSRGLQAAGGKRTQAAALLGISRKNLWQKLKRHDLLQQAAAAEGSADETAAFAQDAGHDPLDRVQQAQ